MRFKFILPFFLLTGIQMLSSAQELTFGPVNGINFSNLRGEMTYNSWNANGGIFFSKAAQLMGKRFIWKVWKAKTVLPSCFLVWVFLPFPNR